MSVAVTVGIDIGTSSVKAVAADELGQVVASARVPHEMRVPTPGRLEHDAEDAWRRGPRAALAELGDLDVRGVSVAAMVPSLTAVDAGGVPVQPGLLYGDERGRTEIQGNPVETGELLAFLRWLVREQPDAHGFWPAQAVANHALGGEAVLDTSTAATAYPLFDWQRWDPAIAAELGTRTEQFPRLVPTGFESQRVDGDGPPLASGCIDALAEQLVAGADDDGDVLVLLGTTLIVWAVTPNTTAVPGLYVLPHTAAGKMLVGGPSNAGGLFCNWAASLLGAPASPLDPDRIPVWVPFPRGERSLSHDPDRRAELLDLNLSHDAASVRRAAFEASGFVTRRILDVARQHHGIAPRRIVASGGGTRVDDWVQAIADATNLPIDCVAVPEGGALGSAWLARIAAGFEEPMAMTEGRRWARVGRTIDPDPAWVEPVAARYEQFRVVAA